MSYTFGKQNRFGAGSFDPFARFNHDFKEVFDPNKKPSTAYDFMPGRKICTVCKQPRSMKGCVYVGPQRTFICAGCK